MWHTYVKGFIVRAGFLLNPREKSSCLYLLYNQNNNMKMIPMNFRLTDLMSMSVTSKLNERLKAVLEANV